MNQEYRLYTFVNFYLSSIQQGIQSAHVVHTLFVKYPTPESNPILWDWATYDKTMIVLNGGTFENMLGDSEMIQMLDIEHNGSKLPHAIFVEDEGLNYLMTSYGVVVPARFYDATFKEDPIYGRYYVYGEGDATQPWTHMYKEDSPEFKFVKLLKSFGLSR